CLPFCPPASASALGSLPRNRLAVRESCMRQHKPPWTLDPSPRQVNGSRRSVSPPLPSADLSVSYSAVLARGSTPLPRGQAPGPHGPEPPMAERPRDSVTWPWPWAWERPLGLLQVLIMKGASLVVLPREVFARGAVEVAPTLLGCVLEHESREGLVAVALTEAEAYNGESDPASHAYRGKTARNGVMYGPTAPALVSFTSARHFC